MKVKLGSQVNALLSRWLKHLVKLTMTKSGVVSRDSAGWFPSKDCMELGFQSDYIFFACIVFLSLMQENNFWQVQPDVRPLNKQQKFEHRIAVQLNRKRCEN